MLGLIKALAENHVKFVVCGGIACVMHGVDRNTYDVNVSVDLEKQNLQKIINISREFNLLPRIPEPAENLLNDEIRNSWIENKGALVYTFISPDSPLQMDIFLRYPISFDELYLKSDKVIIDNIQVPISSIEDLIFAKKQVEPMRDKDKTDIADLKKLRDEKDKS